MVENRKEEPTVTCPLCDGDGEFMLGKDDVITCPECGGYGCITEKNSKSGKQTFDN